MHLSASAVCPQRPSSMIMKINTNVVVSFWFYIFCWDAFGFICQFVLLPLHLFQKIPWALGFFFIRAKLHINYDCFSHLYFSPLLGMFLLQFFSFSDFLEFPEFSHVLKAQSNGSALMLRHALFSSHRLFENSCARVFLTTNSGGDFRSRNFSRGLLTLLVSDLGLSSFVDKETL